MPGKDEKSKESTDVQEPVDFDNSESRLNFLKGQLNDMLDGINNVYGQDLMDELLKRLEGTIEDFNSEVSGLIGKLKEGKIFEDDKEEEEPLPESKSSDDDAPEEEAAREKTFEEQEEEDSDIIARMRKRISHD